MPPVKYVDNTMSDETALAYAEIFRASGLPVIINAKGKPQKNQFYKLHRQTKIDNEESARLLSKKTLSIYEDRPLTKEELDSAMAKLRDGLITKDDFKKILLYQYKRDPLFMATRLFPDHVTDRETKKRIPSPAFHQELIDLFLTHSKLAIAAPRGHSKSTLVGFFYVLHQALFSLKRNIVLVSSTEDLAIRFLRDIKTELEVNRNLIWLFGDQVTGKWSEKEIALANGTKIYAKGRSSQLRGLKERGSRPDLVIIDDCEDQELMRSELRRLDLEDWFNGDVLPTLEPSVGQLIVVGTILHESSLLSRVLNPTLYPDFTTRIYRAIIEPNDDNKLPHPLWPERFPLEMLNSIKESYLARGQLATFYMEYQNNPMPSEGASFKQEYIQYFDELPQINNNTYEPCHFAREMFVDLGGGGLKRTADDTCLMVVATELNSGTMYVQDYLSERMGTDTDRIITALFRLAKQHDVSKIYIEKTQAVNMLVASLDRKLRESHVPFRIEYVTPPRGSADRRGDMSDGKFQRIAAMEAPFKMGQIKIRRWMTKLVDQLLSFPRGHDDAIDALSYAFLFAKKKPHTLKKQWLPPSRHGYLNRNYQYGLSAK